MCLTLSLSVMERRSRKRASRPSQNIYWDLVKGRGDDEESSEEDEGPEAAGHSKGELCHCCHQLLPAAAVAAVAFSLLVLARPCQAFDPFTAPLPWQLQRQGQPRQRQRQHPLSRPLPKRCGLAIGGARRWSSHWTRRSSTPSQGSTM